jgi:hypothetical protein
LTGLCGVSGETGTFGKPREYRPKRLVKKVYFFDGGARTLILKKYFVNFQKTLDSTYYTCYIDQVTIIARPRCKWAKTNKHINIIEFGLPNSI